MRRKGRDINVRKSFKYKDQYNEYTLQMKHRHWWWLLLLLLPLLLVRCSHDIQVVIVDEFDSKPMEGMTVFLDYTSHIPIKDGHILSHKDHHLEQVTDSMGVAYFRDMETSVFAYVFYCLSRAHIKVDGGECFELETGEVSVNFHFTYKEQLALTYKRDDVKMSVMDVEMKIPIAGAKLRYAYHHGGHLITDTVSSDPTGGLVLPHVPVCGKIDTIYSTCHGYYDTLVVNRQIDDIFTNTDSAIVYMRPLKDSFTFFVKDKKSREPIPGATAFITLTFGKTYTSPAIKTNVDGLGRGTYKNAPIMAHLAIHAKALHYKDGDLESNPTIEEFIALPDSQRVVWLEPLPWTEQFQDVDSISGRPVVGVKNYIRVTDGAKEMHAETQVSNRNGYFRVAAEPRNKIEITADKYPEYVIKDTVIPNFSKPEIIRLAPNFVSLTFKTVDAGNGTLVPGCTLRITATVSGANKPTNSGSGEFDVPRLMEMDDLTIISSKIGYETNSTKINRCHVAKLMRSKDPRDFEIPMKMTPCDASAQDKGNQEAGTVSAPQSYNMGTDHGTFDIIYDTGTNCSDCIDIYNHKPGESYHSAHKIWSSGQVATGTEKKESVLFSYGSVITIIVTTGPKDGSFWNYRITCPY